MNRISNAIRGILFLFVPRNEGDGGTGAGDGTDELAQARAALAEANEKLAGMDKTIAAEVERRAYEVAMSILPDYAEAGGGSREHADAPRAPQRVADEDDGGLGTGEDDAVRRELAEVRQAVRSMQEEKAADAVISEMRQLKQKYPEMDVNRCLTALNQMPPEKAERINLEKLAEASHKREMSRLEEYHTRKLAETQQRAKDNPPPPLPPGGPAGVDLGRPGITGATASKTLADMLKARLNWGSGA